MRNAFAEELHCPIDLGAEYGVIYVCALHGLTSSSKTDCGRPDLPAWGCVGSLGVSAAV